MAYVSSVKKENSQTIFLILGVGKLLLWYVDYLFIQPYSRVLKPPRYRENVTWKFVLISLPSKRTAHVRVGLVEMGCFSKSYENKTPYQQSPCTKILTYMHKNFWKTHEFRNTLRIERLPKYK